MRRAVRSRADQLRSQPIGRAFLTKRITMSATESPVQDIESFLDQKIEEAELDLSDVQVKAVIMALCDALARDAKITVELFERVRRVKRGKLSISQIEAWVEEQERAGDAVQHFIRLLFKADVDLEDDAVIVAMTVAKDVLIYAGHVIDSVFEELGSDRAVTSRSHK
jgi:hypothetical protein